MIVHVARTQGSNSVVGNLKPRDTKLVNNIFFGGGGGEQQLIRNYVYREWYLQRNKPKR